MANKTTFRFLSSLLFALILFQNCSAARDEQQPMLSEEKRPNILFILTDDQDLHMNSLSYMPYLKKHLVDQGLSFKRHYCTVALCCPSRVSMWTGKAAHNTNVTDVNPPHGKHSAQFRTHLTVQLQWPINASNVDEISLANGRAGGYPKFVSQGFNEHYVPIWLQAAGYNTYYIGKLFNAQSIHNYDSPHAAGWTGSDFLLDPYTYRYLNATFQRNFDKPKSYEGQYSTDVLAEKTYGFLDDALHDLKSNRKPFFLTVAPIAPHSDVNIKQFDGDFTEDSNVQSPPVPAERHKQMFDSLVVRRTPNFNPDIHGGASWISRLPLQNQSNIDFNDHFYRSRIRALQAVDEMIDSLMNRLSEAGILDSTFVFYSTDNGYSIGQHRRQPGKQCAFEEDVNVPFVVRGPGVPRGEETNLVTTHTDVAPTFLSLAKAEPPKKFSFDGQVIPLSKFQPPKLNAAESVSIIDNEDWNQEHVNVEMWGIIMSEGKYGSVLYPNHTYKALRIVGSAYNLLYTVWCSGEHELYDMATDPYQMINLYNDDKLVNAQFLQPSSDGLNSSIPLPEAITSQDQSQTLQYSRLIDGKAKNGPILSPLIHRLDSLLMVLKTCDGRQCTHPWESLFPHGQVRSLSDALDSRFDQYFAQQVDRVKFDKCEKGYLPDSEGPMWSKQKAYFMTEEMAYN